MSPEMQTVLWITAVGSAALFGSIAGLVALMYVLTTSWLFPKDERKAMHARRRARLGRGGFRRKGTRGVPVAEALKEVEVARDNAEHERRLRAVALATAIACAEISEILLPASALSSDWRLVNRARQLGRLPIRRGPRR